MGGKAISRWRARAKWLASFREGVFVRRIRFLALAATVTLATPAEAWNARGHMVVAAVAWEKMSPEARERAAELLRLSPDYATWVSGSALDAHARIAFMQAATWPDDLRGRVCSDRPECIRDDGYTPPDPTADLNIGYADHRLRRYWHFKDLPFSTDGTPLEEPFSPNAETQIVDFTATLQNSSLSDEAKSFNLSWLLHLVGDVHQPLHATARFSQAFPHGDKGGNGEIVCRPAPARCETTGRYVDKLHGLWDEAIGTSVSNGRAHAKAVKLIEMAETPGSFLGRVVAHTDLRAAPSAWLVESKALAEKYAYAPPITDGRGPHYPTTSYRAAAGSISEQQVLIAGERLAILLNEALGQ